MAEGSHLDGWTEMGPDWEVPPPMRTDIAHGARIYDYFIGGKDNFPADRAAAEHVLELRPSLALAARANRRFMCRAVEYVASQGIRQFLDIGTGIPTSPNTHEVAQSVIPEARVVYVDNDPMVLVHARALLVSAPEGRTAYIDADVRDPSSILDHPSLRKVLDLTEPVCLMLVALLHFVADEEDPYGLVAQLLDACPSGSRLILTHGTEDFSDEAGARALQAYRASGVNLHLRPHAEVLRFFDGLELAEPGLQLVNRWRPDNDLDRQARPQDITWYGAVASKP
ncbi:SAM-dependent methyltransferase [Streptacidiphilus sp. N1-12]|uniref:SAM-dependent methyltransferase n=2 Tax=Streptacidiphilus alkalitolerans TaxID=3342712 RepID=A0ABV6WEZ7_9ACTN